MTRKFGIEVTLREIRDIILNTYVSQEPRRMFIHKSQSGNGGLGAVFFAIEGTPPKGYAIFQGSSYPKNIGGLWIYNAWGKRISIYGQVTIPDLDSVDDNTIIEERGREKGDLKP